MARRADFFRPLLLALLLIQETSACTTTPYTGEQQASDTAKGAAIGAAAGVNVLCTLAAA